MISQNSCLNDHFFIQAGDLETISAEILDKYFGGELNSLKPEVSCAYKHMLAYAEIAGENQSACALILEDDIYCSPGFCAGLNKIMAEIKQRQLDNYLISLDDSDLKYASGSERRKNILLYKKLKFRGSGAYLIDGTAARSMLSEIESNRCNLPIDWFIKHCAEKGLVNVYWAHPTVAWQGSADGTIKSLIDDKPTGLIRNWKFNINKLYKRFLYGIR